MAGVAKSYNPSQIVQGPGDLWFIGLAPTDTAVRLTLASDGSPDATAHPGSVHLGAIAAAITTSVKPKVAAITTDQFEAPIDSYLTEIDAQIQAEMAQTESSKLQRMLGVGTYATGVGYEYVTWGGTFTVPTGCFAVISPSRLNAQQYVVSVLYVGVALNGFTLALARAKAASYKATIQGLSDPTRTAGQQVGVLYQTLVNAAGGTPTVRNFMPAEIYQGPADLWLVSPAPTDAAIQVTLDAASLTPSITAHATSTHLGLTEGACTIEVQPKIELIRSDQFDGAIAAYVNTVTCKIEATLLQSTMQNLATALGVGNYSTTAGNFAQCTFGGTNQPPTLCVAAVGLKRTTPTKAVCACLYRVNAADGITWTAQRTKASTFKVSFTGQSDVTRTAGRQIGIYQEMV